MAADAAAVRSKNPDDIFNRVLEKDRSSSSGGGSGRATAAAAATDGSADQHAQLLAPSGNSAALLLPDERNGGYGVVAASWRLPGGFRESAVGAIARGSASYQQWALGAQSYLVLLGRACYFWPANQPASWPAQPAGQAGGQSGGQVGRLAGRQAGRQVGRLASSCTIHHDNRQCQLLRACALWGWTCLLHPHNHATAHSREFTGRSHRAPAQ